jgi:exoribonuclease-2
MQEHGFLPDFSKAGLHELESAHQAGWQAQFPCRDLLHMLWASIDNDDSLDLDQLMVTEALLNKKVKLLVAIVDVDVEKGYIDFKKIH